MTSAGGISGFSRDPGEVQQRIDQWAQGFADKAARYRAAQEQVEQIRTSAASPDGGVRVTVRADGSVTDLQFTERVRSLPLPELASQILRTMQAAQANVVGHVGETMHEQLGDEDAQTRALLMDELRTRFPEPPQEPEVAEQVSEKWDYDRDEPGAGGASAPPSPPSPSAPPAPPAPPAPQPPPHPRRRPGDDDEGFDSDFDPLRD